MQTSSLKTKGTVLDEVIALLTGGAPYFQIMGYDGSRTGQGRPSGEVPAMPVLFPTTPSRTRRAGFPAPGFHFRINRPEDLIAR